jgi:hypothetical protein
MYLLHPFRCVRWIIQRVRYAVLYGRFFTTAIRLQISSDYFMAETRNDEEAREIVLRRYGFLHFGLVNSQLDDFVASSLVSMHRWTFQETCDFRLWFLDAYVSDHFVEMVWKQYRNRHLRQFFHIIRSL